MRSFVPIALAAVLLTGTPALSQDERPNGLPPDLDQLLNEMLDQLKPALTEMFRMMEQFEGIDDPRYYRMPEVLPNGDIIIRRKPDAPPFERKDPDSDGQEETKT